MVTERLIAVRRQPVEDLIVLALSAADALRDNDMFGALVAALDGATAELSTDLHQMADLSV